MQKCETLYQKIYDTYRERILSGELPEGSKLPTEAELMSAFSVSRITAKRALDELEHDGYIRRRRGSGSYVNSLPSQGGTVGQGICRVGLIMPSAEHETNLFYAMMQGATDFLCRHHGQLVCYHSNRDEQTEQQMLLQARADGCDGILYYPGPIETARDILLRMAAVKYPIVMLDKAMDSLPVSCVASDNVAGGCAQIRHVIEKGHKKIAFLSTAGDLLNTSGERYMGCFRGMVESELPAENLVNQGIFDSVEELYANLHRYNEAALERLVKLLPRWKEQGITAVCTLNDNAAMRVYEAAKVLGYSIPGDIAVAGFDNAEYAAYVSPALTTVHQDFYQVGYQGAQVLWELMENPDLPPRYIRIDTRLIVRQSV